MGFVINTYPIGITLPVTFLSIKPSKAFPNTSTLYPFLVSSLISS